VTALELVAAGVRFARAGGKVRVLAPKGRADLVEAMRVEVDRRIALVGSGDIPRNATGAGACDVCLDALANGRGGTCTLCDIARGKAVDRTGRRMSW
jgi:hypothetical protein